MRLSIVTLFAWIVAGSTWANPVRLVRQARMDIQAQPEAGALEQLSAWIGGGSADRMTWLPEEEQPLTGIGHWPIVLFQWSEIGFSFIPQSNGMVHLDLLGPWEMSPGGTIWRQEVLWDHVRATGADVTNGSFEQVTGGVPDGWANPWGEPVAIETTPPAADGIHSVNAWHDRRLRTTLSVQGGVPVEIRARVRAHVPDGFEDNPRIADTNSAGHRAARRFMRGVNLSNWFEAPAGEDWGGGPLGTSDFAAVRAEGFDHVRLPVSWNYHTGPAPAYTISNAFFVQVDTVVTGLLARGIRVILNVHHFNEFYGDPAAWTNKLYAIWDQLADHFAAIGDDLAFEILNEPHDEASTEIMNNIYAFLLPRLRLAAPTRPIFVGPGNWNGIGELPLLRLPVSDSNLVVSVHSYAPFLYTHQGATWTGPETATTNVMYPGPPVEAVTPHPDAAGEWGVAAWFEAYNTQPTERNPCSSNAFQSALQLARAWSDYYGRPVHVGEFGAFSTSDDASRARFYREMREGMDRRGLGWASWDWKSGFYYWDRDAGAPGPGLREAFFPTPSLAWTADGLRLVSESAVGKILRLDRAGDLRGAWSGIHTQELVGPAWIFGISPLESPAFFRIVWLWNAE